MRRVFVAPVVSFALASIPAAAFAQQQIGGWTVDIYGQINLGILSIDDGVASDTYFTDNDNSNSRFGLTADRELQNGAALKFRFESAIGLSGSAGVTPANDDLELEYRRTELRKFEIAYVTPGFGTFSIGQGSTAADGVAEQDFSGTGVIAYSGFTDLGAATPFRLANGTQSAVTVGDAFSNFDGARRFRVRYDSPDFNGFSFALSHGEEVLRSGDDRDFQDVGLHYARDAGAYEYAASLGYSWIGDTDEAVAGSVALRHKASGFNAALASGQDVDGDASYTYVKVGVVRDWVSWGSTAISLDYYDGSDFAVLGSDSKSVGLSVVQRVDKANLELFATYRTNEFSDPSNAYRDVDLVMVGGRWKF